MNVFHHKSFWFSETRAFYFPTNKIRITLTRDFSSSFQTDLNLNLSVWLLTRIRIAATRLHTTPFSETLGEYEVLEMIEERTDAGGLNKEIR